MFSEPQKERPKRLIFPPHHNRFGEILSHKAQGRSNGRMNIINKTQQRKEMSPLTKRSHSEATMLDLPKFHHPPRKEHCCESSLMFNVRFRRCKLLNQLLPALAFLSVFANVYLVVNRKSYITNSITSYHPIGRFLDMPQQLPVPVEPTTEIKEELSHLIKSKEEIMNMELEAKKKRRHFGPKLVTPQPLALDDSATFSACLLIKDDNAILSEWIAYHYHTVNLRHLVVAVDPSSVESPATILSQWRQNTDIKISQWNDTDYMPQSFIDTGYFPNEYLQDESDFEGMSSKAVIEISSHRYRQRVFLAKCLQKFRNLGQTWTMHIDTDEYVVPSKLFREIDPDYVKTQPITQPGSVLRLLQRTAKKTPALINYPCVSMMRMLFGSVEDELPTDESNSIVVKRTNAIPDGFNATAFESLRWRHHAPETNATFHGNPKVIIDVSAISAKDFPTDLVYSIHRPIRKYCPKNNDLDYNSYHKQPIAANHYLGSYERYSGRSDKRRNRSIYDKKALVNAGTDDGTILWLKGFTDNIGDDVAAKLLGQQYLSDNQYKFHDDVVQTSSSSS